MWQVLRELLFMLPAEAAHEFTFRVAKVLDGMGLWHRSAPQVFPIELWGLTFPHPIGLAAGLDKNAELLRLWAHLGFAFVEVGTITPRPQPGNPRPRLFRIPRDGALLNRMGFNNDGAVAIARRLERRPSGLILGINIGKNKDTPLSEAHKDYAEAFRILRDLGDFFVINVSSPNTPGLRSLQTRGHLSLILEAIQKYNTTSKPLLLKLSPDLTEETIEEVGRMCQKASIAGFVAGNTTTSISYPNLGEGGVSGRPLRPLRRRLISHLRSFGLPIIGVGGIFSAEDVEECLNSGATLIELYTALVYEGPSLPKRLLKHFTNRTP
ncbi:MAG: quinone-dependent dihydroorotate dehydrogenase [Bacteroidia bacterium]|nr:quinone-dependent dihydroorotate dehydrogenase [Bacteroidia bacterium]MDW8416633.1 quinone-dependent dihydroorotate dehydrogenase [Bacteroidia bacterium]